MRNKLKSSTILTYYNRKSNFNTLRYAADFKRKLGNTKPYYPFFNE